jgi:hypothetical protein
VIYQSNLESSEVYKLFVCVSADATAQSLPNLQIFVIRSKCLILQAQFRQFEHLACPR